VELPKADELSSLATLLVPGVIIVAVRTRAIKGSMPDLKDQVLAYAILSVLYTACIAPAFHDHSGISLSPFAWGLFYNLLTPLLIGIILSFWHQYRINYKLADAIGLRLFSHIPTAWDYTFETVAANSFVLVRLKDDTEIAGRLGNRSFISSDPKERDILIESVWDATSVPWTEADPPRSVLVCPGDIRSIEIF
jgi:hypothetical protein